LEPGGINISGIVGLHAALGLLMETGIDEIASKLISFGKVIKADLFEKGYDLIGPVNSKHSSGITSFSSRTQDMSNLRQELDKKGFVVSLRNSFDGRKVIRVSPHFYNSDDEIASFLSELPYC
jgi:selenocysteine lyase/cysteine desulfurase